MHNGSTRMRGQKGEGKKKTFEGKIAENFLNYLKNINLEKLEYIWRTHIYNQDCAVLAYR